MKETENTLDFHVMETFHRHNVFIIQILYHIP